ncbi:MAG: hypothetical protein C0424_09250 [Sphingobacteriaceae bacterium]|nr:hypothetical protein [Sphingobacteriaceae bacterium]
MKSLKIFLATALLTTGLSAIAQINSVVSLPKHGSTFAIDDANNRLLVATVKFKPRFGLIMVESSELHLFELSTHQLLRNVALDSAFLGFVPFHIASFSNEILIFGYADLGRDTFSQQTNHQFGNSITILRIRMPSYSIDTITHQFTHNIHTSYPIKIAQGWLLLSSLKASHPNIPSPSEFLNARYLNNQFQILKDTSIFQRQGLDARGAMFQFGQLTDSLLYVLCGGCKMHVTNTEPPFRRGEHDVAIYDLSLNLKQNTVFLASNQTPNWPFSNNQTIMGPGIVAGVLAIGANNFIQLAEYRDANQTPIHSFWNDGRRDLYLTKFNEFGQVINRHYYGNAGITDNLLFSFNQLAQGGNGRIYALSTTNTGASLVFPDSIQSIFVHSVDNQLLNPNSFKWHDGADVYGQQIKATPSGVYVFANSTARGGEKFHVLRIEGTAWASSSSQQVWPEWGVFPNPARERVFISGELPSNISLHDMQGRLLHQWSALENNELQLPALPPGIYLLHGSNAQGKRWPVRKLVVR